jgi:hypothetical protein
MSMMSIFRKDLEKFKKNISEAYLRANFEFDPSTLDDEIAMKIRWNPKPDKIRRANEYTYRLKEISPRQIKFIVQRLTLYLPVLFLFMSVGITVMIGGWLAALNRDFNLALFSLPSGIGLFLIGFIFFCYDTTPCHIFDLSLGYYWKGRNKISPIDMKKVKNRCRLQDIHAIQLLEEYVVDGYIYELNLVLKDGKRLNVIDLKEQAYFRSEAQRLGQFLNIPVWDATYGCQKCTKIEKSKSHLRTVKFNPSPLNDKIAMKTQWKPVKVGGGTNIRTHRLKEISPRRIEYIARGSVLCLLVVFVLLVVSIFVGISVIIAGGIAEFSRDSELIFFCIGPVIIGFSIIFLFFHYNTTPYIFDLNLGYYWEGRNKISPIDMKKVKNRCRLQDIHAIQLLERYCNDSGLYYSYELNLVLKDGKRLNVMDHSRRAHIRSDAQRLGQFLKVPIWDAIFEEV